MITENRVAAAVSSSYRAGLAQLLTIQHEIVERLQRIVKNSHQPERTI
jgi:hypothetical protein